MSIVLLLSSVILIFILFFLHFTESGVYSNIRKSFILSLITNAVLIFSLNEALSFFDEIYPQYATVFWVIVLFIVTGILWYLQSKGKIHFSKLADLWKAFRLVGITTSNKLISIVAILFFILPLLFLAVYAPPNNFDSHSYHLNRILFWVNNHNLDHFPTLHLQQLYLNVFAEYLVLDTVLLSGSDRFAGLIQFGAFIGSLSAISLLARKFRMRQDGQLLSVIFLLTLPIGIFESTSTQVDYVACFFFISFVYFGFELLEKKTLLVLLAFILSLSFGGFSKYTIFIFAIPFTLFFAVRILVRYRILYAIKVLCLAIVLLGATFTPFFYRNYALFGHIMSPPRDSVFATEELPATKYSLILSLSGVIKNVGLNLGLPNNQFNLFVNNQIIKIHDWLGVDVNDSAVTRDPFSVKYSVHEDMVPNTVHFWIILAVSIMLLFVRGRWNVKWFWICSVLGFVLFCTLMKFQLWSTRTQMPFFAMGAVLVAFVFAEKISLKSLYLIAPLMLFSLPFVYGNPNKELFSINYFTRKILGHIPIAICETGGKQAENYKKNLGAYYDFPGANNCHPLKKWPDYRERRKVFALLEDVGYYDLDRSSNIIAMDRDKAYFLSHPESYRNFRPLLDHIEGDNKNIGILFRTGNGFYHYWAAIADKIKSPGTMAYITYKKEFMILPNARKEFCYDYILSDDAAMVTNFVPHENIDTIYTTRLFRLVKLKHKSCDRKLF